MFRNCAYFGIFFTTLNGPDPKDVLLENNVFEATKQWNGQNAPYAVNIANWLSRVENFTIRNNTFGGDIAIQPNTIVNSKIVGNIGAGAELQVRASTYAYNVWTSAQCSSTDKRDASAMSQFVNPAAHDWHLKSGAPRSTRREPTDSRRPTATARAAAARADAGAHEYGGDAPTTPTPTPTPTPDADADADPHPAADAGHAGAVGAAGHGVDDHDADQHRPEVERPTDNVGVTGYRIYRNGTRVATTTSTSYTVTGLACNTSYTIGLTAIDAAGNESNRAEATGTTKTSACARRSPRRGLVGAWGFDEARARRSPTPPARATPARSRADARHRAASAGRCTFDGVNDWVTVADAASLDLTTGMTLEAWVKPRRARLVWRTVAIKEGAGARLRPVCAHDRDAPTGHVQPGTTRALAARARCPRNTGRTRDHLGRHDAAALRRRQAGRQRRRVRHHRTSGALRIGGNAIWAEWFDGADRRDPRLQPRAHAAESRRT